MEFLTLLKEKMKLVDMDRAFMSRPVNEGFSGGEKKRNEILQMAVLEPRLAILDETDSGLDIDALRTVADGINRLRRPDNAIVLVTHYQRLLELRHAGPGSRTVRRPHREIRRQGPWPTSSRPADTSGSRRRRRRARDATDRTTQETFLAAYARARARAPSRLGLAARWRAGRAIDRFAERGLPDDPGRGVEVHEPRAARARRGSTWRRRRAARCRPRRPGAAPHRGRPRWSRGWCSSTGGTWPSSRLSGRCRAGGRVGSLARGADHRRSRRCARTSRPRAAAAESGDAFGALNAAFWADGAFSACAGWRRASRSRSSSCSWPPRARRRADHPRSLVVLEPDSRPALVESYVAPGRRAPT